MVGCFKRLQRSPSRGIPVPLDAKTMVFYGYSKQQTTATWSEVEGATTYEVEFS